MLAARLHSSAAESGLQALRQQTWWRHSPICAFVHRASTLDRGHMALHSGCLARLGPHKHALVLHAARQVAPHEPCSRAAAVPVHPS